MTKMHKTARVCARGVPHDARVRCRWPRGQPRARRAHSSPDAPVEAGTLPASLPRCSVGVCEKCEQTSCHTHPIKVHSLGDADALVGLVPFASARRGPRPFSIYHNA
jgi:hypothetical protein